MKGINITSLIVSVVSIIATTLALVFEFSSLTKFSISFDFQQVFIIILLVSSFIIGLLTAFFLLKSFNKNILLINNIILISLIACFTLLVKDYVFKDKDGTVFIKGTQYTEYAKNLKEKEQIYDDIELRHIIVTRNRKTNAVWTNVNVIENIIIAIFILFNISLSNLIILIARYMSPNKRTP